MEFEEGMAERDLVLVRCLMSGRCKKKGKTTFVTGVAISAI